MKFLIVNTDYPEFLKWLYGEHPGLERLPYDEQMRVRMESLFGVADFYSSNLRKLGHDAWDIHANNEFLQRAWARQHGHRTGEPETNSSKWQETLHKARRAAAKTPLWHLRPLLKRVLPVSHSGLQPTWLSDILRAQIQHYKPDVLLNQAMDAGIDHLLKEIKPCVRLMVGQHAATALPAYGGLDCYDLLISSFPPTVDCFRQGGIPAELHRLAFEPRVLAFLRKEEISHDITFIGSFHSIHSSRVALLEYVCAWFPHTGIWGPAVDPLSPASAIRKCYVNQAWGRWMYEILYSSRITLNHHGDIPPFANNLRLFEATGVGTLLITDWKANLHEMFEPGKEVVTYRAPEECVELIQYYLRHEDEREAISRAGQQRTLQEHTYAQRMQELVQIVRKYL